MISSGQMRNDANQVRAYLTSFYSAIDGLNSCWRGPSFDSIHSQTDQCVQEYSQVIESQMETFAQAIDLYQQYITAKKNVHIASGNYTQAAANNRAQDAANFYSQTQSFSGDVNQLKNQIIELLNSINKKLEASSELFITNSDGTQRSLNAATVSGTIEYHVARYTGCGKEGDPNSGTTVWYAVIPKGMMPKMAMANDDLTKVGQEFITKMAKRKNATLGINLSVTQGMMFTDGKLVRESTIDYGETLILKQDGTLDSVPNSQYSTQDILNLNPVWAAKGFFAICRNGQFISEHDDKETDYIVNNRHPRTFIGQDSQGNYIVGVCAGRRSGEAGMYMEEIYDFVRTTITPDIKFLYNADGGGSSSFVFNGEKLNPNIDNGNQERLRPNMIYW